MWDWGRNQAANPYRGIEREKGGASPKTLTILYERMMELKHVWRWSLLHSMFFIGIIKEFM